MPPHDAVEAISEPESAAGERPHAERSSLFGDLCEQWALLAFAVAQPIYSRLLNRPMYIERQTAESLWMLAGLLSVVLPLVLAATSAALWKWLPEVYRNWHAVVWTMLLGALTLLSVRHVAAGLPYPVVALVVVVLTAGLSFLRRRLKAVGSLMRLAAVGALLFPVAFGLEISRVGRDPRSTDAAVPIQHPAPVVMVVFDEFCGVTLMDANREINAARYPGFAELASQSTWYRNATSVHPRTDRAIPAMLSGLFPDREVQPLAREYPQNLFSVLLKGRTYDPVVMEPYTRLYPLEELKRYPSGSRYHDSTGEMLRTLGLAYLQELLPEDQPLIVIDLPLSWFNVRNADEEFAKRNGLIMHPWDRLRGRQFEQFLDCLTPRDRPALYFAHFCLPHYPWCFLPSGRRYEDDMGIYGGLRIPGGNGEVQEDWGPDELATDQACAQYILQTQYVDREISRLIARLKEIGVYDECLLVIAGDHGVSFRPNRSRRIAKQDSLADIMSIPLFMKLPHQTAGKVSDRNVETVDVFPTMMEVLGVELSTAVDGASFLDPSLPEKPVKRFFNEKNVFETDSAFEEKYAVLAHLVGKFGGGKSPGRMYRLGPHSELIGRPVDQLRAQEDAVWKAAVDSPRTFTADDQFVPCRLVGKVEGPADEPSRALTLAIAVNGVVQGTTRTYTQPEFRSQWSVLLPEDVFQEGENQVEVLVLDDSKSANARR